MWLLAALLLRVLVGVQADPTKAVITLSPQWANIFQGENANFLCEPGNSSTKWFHNGTAIETLGPKYSIAFASFNDSGDYSCQTGLSLPSDPVQLYVYKDWLLLQVSNRNPTEGDSLTLKCHGWNNKHVVKVLFYHERKFFKFCRGSTYTIPQINMSDGGDYRCVGTGEKFLYRSKGIDITVRELFPVPVLRMSPYKEGLKLTCETKLLQQKPGLQLNFFFYMGNKTLQSWNTSPEYQIFNTSEGCSDSYQCEAVTVDGKIRKRNQKLKCDDQSQITVGLHIISHTAPATMYLLSTVFYIIIHKDLQKKKRNLNISSRSAHGKKATSSRQKERLSEKPQHEHQEEHPQESTPQEVPQEEARLRESESESECL